MENYSYFSGVWLRVLENSSIIIFTICLILIYTYFKITYTYWQSRGVPQYNPSFPFGDFGSVIFRRENMAEKLNKIYEHARLHGHKYVGVYFFSRKAVLAVDPLLIRNILAHFNDRGLYYDEKNDPMNAHLFSLSGPKWKRLRTKLAPAYSAKQLKGMFGIMLDCGLKLKDLIGEHVDTGQPLKINEIIARYTTDVIGSCAYGLECNSMQNSNAEFRLMGKRAFDQTFTDLLRIIVIRCTPKLAKILGLGVFCSYVTEFFRRVVKETIEYREKNNVHRDDFLQILINLKNTNKNNGNTGETEKSETDRLTVDEAASQAFIFFLAGFETTSTTISFAIFELALNNDIQEKARLEVRNVLEKHGGVWCYDGFQELTYVDMIIRETMRKYPAAPVFLRKCTDRYQLPDHDAVIEEGFTVLISCFSLQRDPEYFPNPDRFDPDRFLMENWSKVWDYTYIPFGDGPRACIGMRFAMLQMKITLTLLLQNYTFNLNSKTKLPISMEPKGILLAPVGGIWIDFKHNKLSC